MGEIMEIKKNNDERPPGSEKSDRKRSDTDPLEGMDTGGYPARAHSCAQVCICFENRDALGEVIVHGQ